MGITVKRTGRLPGPAFLDDRAADGLARVAMAIIRTRTFDRGIGADDTPLPAYSPAYARQRAAERRRVSPPDYTRTGRLRRSMRSVARRRGARTRITLGTVGQRAIVAAVLNRRGAGWLAFAPSDRPKFRKTLRLFIKQTRQRQGVA